jgi:dihydrofolate synthase / folylpolyglutamate synthase
LKSTAPDALNAALDRFYARTAKGIRPGLEVIEKLLAALNRPQRTFPAIHVAGTNGKGSVCAMIASVLQQAGYRTGCYTSPHLRHFNERIQVNRTPVPDDRLVKLIDQVEAVANRVRDEEGMRDATFFECATAMADLYFAEEQIDWAVIETGMGGRWDATNLHDTALSVLTRIDIDHTRFLGTDIRAIANEKAGIIKPGVPVVCGTLQAAVEPVVWAEAKQQRAPLLRADQMVRIQRLQQDWDGQKIRIETDERTLRPLLLPLIGRHQLENAAIAVAALETLQATGRIELTDEALRDGLIATRWPARCQVIARDPLTLLDVAHNPDGARALGRTLKELAGSRPVGMIVGFLEDKDVRGCVAGLAAMAERFWAVDIKSSRALPGTMVAEVIAGTGLPVTTCALAEAMEAARAWARAADGIVCIAGSLYLAGEVQA